MKKLFLVGCPRSGTTWLQIILGSHSEIATRRETHLFDGYMASLYNHWQREVYAPHKDGLRVLLDQAEFDTAIRHFCDVVFAKIAASKPGADYILEKTPGHVLHHHTIRRLYPESRFLHLVRDPRAVVASLLAVKKEPWGSWAPADAFQAARIWRNHVAIGHELARDHAACLELRFEDLVATPDAVLDRLYRWLGLDPVTYDTERFSLCHLKQHQGEGEQSDPAREDRGNFFRHGLVNGWATELTRAQIAVVEGICAELIVELGYAPQQVGVIGYAPTQ
ncbi:MAG TPA: sulfotransferase [Stellaceae bacterium]|jgi:hypothetical protein|nr:sulfotransferase [Stellaceae bacterium]